MDAFIPQSIIHELIHAIHYNFYSFKTPEFYTKEDGIKEKINNYSEIKKYIRKINNNYSNNNHSIINNNITESAVLLFQEYSNKKRISLELLFRLHEKINNYKIIQINKHKTYRKYVAMIDSILEGKTFSGEYRNAFGLKIRTVGHPKEYFQEDDRYSFAEFIADYLAIKLTNSNYQDLLKDFYQIIGPNNTKKLEEYSNNFIKVKTK